MLYLATVPWTDEPLRDSIICVWAAMSIYPDLRFLTSAAESNQLAPDLGREIAFAGRSNSGKSTAINAVTQRPGLARVSRTPGRTQLINFFELASERRLVDLPGYGFAKVPDRVRLHWLQLMEHYFNVRESLVGLILIVDSRRGLGTQDAGMLEWVLARDRVAHVLLTKSDKLNRRDAQRVLRETARLAPIRRSPRNCSRRTTRKGSRRRARSWTGGWRRPKKKPRWLLRSSHRGRPTRHGDDKPGHSRSGRRAGSVFHAH